MQRRKYGASQCPRNNKLLRGRLSPTAPSSRKPSRVASCCVRFWRSVSKTDLAKVAGCPVRFNSAIARDCWRDAFLDLNEAPLSFGEVLLQ
jgi:hypothetical protein